MRVRYSEYIVKKWFNSKDLEKARNRRGTAIGWIFFPSEPDVFYVRVLWEDMDEEALAFMGTLVLSWD